MSRKTPISVEFCWDLIWLLHVHDAHNSIRLHFRGKANDRTYIHASYAPITLYLFDIDSDCLSINLTVELEKASHCDLKVSNATDKYVAFKVCFCPELLEVILVALFICFMFTQRSDVISNIAHDAFTNIIFLPFLCFFLGQNYFTQEILCTTKYWCYTAQGYKCHKRYWILMMLLLFTPF